MSMSKSEPRVGGFAGTFVLLLLASAVLFSLYMAAPPTPIPANAPNNVFSAYRALDMNREFSSFPHPAGSAANDVVRDYIFKKLRSFGVEAEIYEGFYIEGDNLVYGVNVMGRIPGTAGTKAVVLEAHYDSVPYGPGATDDCAGVAAMLESARAIKAGPPLKNDVLFVFSDGEEYGLLGAEIFGRSPWFKDLGVIVNFESRGNTGPSIMFETSDQNGWLISEMMKAPGVSPHANSMGYEVYKRMPFASDLSTLKNMGAKGLNCAFIGNFAHYHTMNDNPDNLNKGSLQQHGQYALGLARHFGNLPLDKVTAPDVVYFNILGPLMIRCSLEANRILALVIGAFFLLVLGFGLVRRHLSFSGVLAGVLAFLITAAIAMGAAFIVLCIIYGPQAALRLYTVNITHLPDLRAFYRSNEYIWSCVLMTIGIVGLMYNGWMRLIKTLNLASGAMLVWFAGLIGVYKWLPGGAYLLYWPLAFSSTALAILILNHDSETPLTKRLTLLAFAAVPSIMLWAPSFSDAKDAVMVMAAPVLMLAPCLLMGLVIPQFDLFTGARKWTFPLLFLAAGIAFFTWAFLTNTPSPLRPNLDSLAYTMNVDTGQSYWISTDKAPDEWTSQFFLNGMVRGDLGEILPLMGGNCMRAAAPKANLQGTLLAVEKDEIREGVRELTLRLASPDKPSSLRLVSSGAKVFSGSVLGSEITARDGVWRMNFSRALRKDVIIDLKTEPGKPLKIQALEEHLVLPASIAIPPRPNYIIPETNTVNRNKPVEGQRTFVARSFEFPPVVQPVTPVASAAPGEGNVAGN
jgi:hypothetical protein